MEQYRLYALINVFKIIPTFLLPVFSDGSEYYAQNFNKCTITSFTKLDLDYFIKCQSKIHYNIDCHKKFECNGEALYGISLDGDIVYGNYTEIASVIESNEQLVNRDHEFAEEAKQFILQMQNLEIPSGQSDIMHETTPKEPQSLVIRKPTALVDYQRKELEILPVYDSEENEEVKNNIYGKIHAKKISDIFNLNLTSTVNSEIDDLFTVRRHYDFSSFLPNSYKDNDILFKSYTSLKKDNYLLLNNYRVIKRRGQRNRLKNSCLLPIETQISIIKTLIKTTPKEASNIVKFNNAVNLIGYHNKQKRNRYDIIKQITHEDYSPNHLLWTMDDLQEISQRFSNRKIPHRVFNHMLYEWNLNITVPLLPFLFNANSNDFVCNYIQEVIEEAEEMEQHIFLFTTKVLSKRTDVWIAIAQDFITCKNYFSLYTSEPKGRELITFFSNLMQDTSQRVYLITDDKFYVDFDLSEWMHDNEDKCKIKASPLHRMVNI